MRRAVKVGGLLLLALLASCGSSRAAGVGLKVDARLLSQLTLPSAVSPQQIQWPAPPMKSAAAVLGVGAVDGPDDSPVPIASLTKMMTAYVVLKDHPLKVGEQGPLLLMGPADVLSYEQYVNQNASAVQVAAGEALSEYQLLQGLLVGSADNFADILANWDAGNLGSFVQKMNQAAADLGLSHTHYVDASGLSPYDTSTALDQVKLASVLMENPVFSAIVDQPYVVLPVAGVVHGFNPVLGQEGVVGVKSGYTTAAGASLVLAADREVGGEQVVVLSAVLGYHGPLALKAVGIQALSLLDSFASHLKLSQPSRLEIVLKVDGRKRRAHFSLPALVLIPGEDMRAVFVPPPRDVKLPARGAVSIGVMRVEAGQQVVISPVVLEGGGRSQSR